MYVYFDKNGVLKEYINDRAVRVGSNNTNKIFIYFENDVSFTDVYWVMLKANGVMTNEKSIFEDIVYQAIPYDKNRDLKFFEDFKTYKFYVITFERSDLDVSGLALLTIRALSNENIFAEGLVTFNIENNVIKDDHCITQSQYEYLLSRYSSIYKELTDNRVGLLSVGEYNTQTGEIELTFNEEIVDSLRYDEDSGILEITY